MRIEVSVPGIRNERGKLPPVAPVVAAGLAGPTPYTLPGTLGCCASWSSRCCSSWLLARRSDASSARAAVPTDVPARAKAIGRPHAIHGRKPELRCDISFPLPQSIRHGAPLDRTPAVSGRTESKRTGKDTPPCGNGKLITQERVRCLCDGNLRYLYIADECASLWRPGPGAGSACPRRAGPPIPPPFAAVSGRLSDKVKPFCPGCCSYAAVAAAPRAT